MQTQITTKSAYRCDTDLLIREVLVAREELFAHTARRACRVLVHPLDLDALIVAPIGTYGPVVGIGPDGRPRLLELVMFTDPAIHPGMAQVEICDGCLSYWRSCEHKTRDGVNVDALAQRVAEERARTVRPADPAPPKPSKPQPTTKPTPKYTRRPSRRELERRAATADRKAAEAAAKAERARQALEGAAD